MKKLLLVLILALFLSCVEQEHEPNLISPVYAGYPEGIDVTVLGNEGFVVGYSDVFRNPMWVGYRLFDRKGAETHKRPGRFKVDARTKSCVSHDDYTNSGYDRGHMAPNYGINVCYGREGQLDTFYMSNIAPQKPHLNRQIWRLLEEKVAKVYTESFQEIWVITGPIFDQHTEMLDSGVDVPDAFYKIIIDEQAKKPRAMAFIIKQDAKRTSHKLYLVSIDEVEKQTGLDFFHHLDDKIEDALESKVAKEMWKGIE